MSDVKETLAAFIARKTAENKEAVIVPEDPWGPQEKLPGLEHFTLEMAQVYEITWEMLEIISKCKKELFQPMLVPASSGHGIVRGISRREWAELQKEIITESEARAKEHREIKSNPDWINKDLELHGEEKVVLRALMYPRYNTAELRALPAGDISLFAQAIIAASGFEPKNGLPPVRL